jgi:hypothetical protein
MRTAALPRRRAARRSGGRERKDRRPAEESAWRSRVGDELHDRGMLCSGGPLHHTVCVRDEPVTITSVRA